MRFLFVLVFTLFLLIIFSNVTVGESGALGSQYVDDAQKQLQHRQKRSADLSRYLHERQRNRAEHMGTYQERLRVHEDLKDVPVQSQEDEENNSEGED